MHVRILFILALLASPIAHGEEIRMIGKSVMFSGKSILSNVIDSRDHRSLIRAIKSVGLEKPLMRRGTYTVFAPTDAAFAALPDSIRDRLETKPSRDAVARMLACHVVANNDLAGRNLSEITQNGQTVELATIGGCILKIERDATGLIVSLNGGNKARITNPDIPQMNGLVEIIDQVLLTTD